MPFIDLLVEDPYVLLGLEVHVLNAGVSNWLEFCPTRIYKHTETLVEAGSSDRFVAGYVSFGSFDKYHFLDPQLEPSEYVNWEYSQFRAPKRQFPCNLVRLWMRKGVHGLYKVVKARTESSAGGMILQPKP